MVDFCGLQGMEVSRCHQQVQIIDPGLSMGVLGSDDNTYRVPIIDLREVAFASAPLKARNTWKL